MMAYGNTCQQKNKQRLAWGWNDSVMSSALKQNKTNTIKYSDDLEVQNICTQVELYSSTYKEL